MALLVEAPGWERGARATRPDSHSDPARVALAEAGAALLQGWLAEGLPGIARADEAGDDNWLLDYDKLLPALGERVAAGERCWLAVETRVRGISVIENAILGTIAEDSRYDARQVVNAAEDERYAAFARMIRQPDVLELTQEGGHHGSPPLPRDRSALAIGETAVRGAWRMRGVAGWPLLALGAAAQLAQRLVESPPA